MQQTIELVVTDKMLLFKDDSPHAYLVSHNDDYVMHIELEERRNAMFAAFVRNKQAVKCTIDADGYVLNSDNERKVPGWALSAPVMTVGVISDGYATTPLNYSVRGSIKQMYGEEIVQPDDPLVEQLIALVNGIETLPTVTEDDNGKVAKVVDGIWQAAEESGGSSLPDVTELDNGKVLMVQEGSWAKADLPIYDGTFEITPRANEAQTLNTQATYVDRNITVTEIPKLTVSNPAGGETCTIG